MRANTTEKSPLPLPKSSMRGLYLHVPFCFHKCHYCDFYSIAEPRTDVNSRSPDTQATFCHALLEELKFQASCFQLSPESIFVGGGTPTLLHPDLWLQIFESFSRLNLLEQMKEFTVEANPETVTPKLMATLVDGGVNRISIGAQSFNPILLKTLERWHEPQSVCRAVDIIRHAGIQNINLDLIFAIPGQTLQLLVDDITSALALKPNHISCYGLTYEPNTPMTQRLRTGQFQPIDEQLERDMYALVLETLAAAGYEHYEISNWSRLTKSQTQNRLTSTAAPGAISPSSRRCRHNLIYWTNQNWLGLGPSAASHVEGHRWKNEPHLGRYIAGSPQPPTVNHETLSADRRIGEQLMLFLRLRDGAPHDWLNDNLAHNDIRWKTIDQMKVLGMLESTITHLRLTERGVFVADSIIENLL